MLGTLLVGQDGVQERCSNAASGRRARDAGAGGFQPLLAQMPFQQQSLVILDDQQVQGGIGHFSYQSIGIVGEPVETQAHHCLSRRIGKGHRFAQLLAPF